MSRRVAEPRRRPAPRPSTGRTALVIASVVLFLGLGAASGMMMVKWRTTGHLSAPTRGDFVRIKDKLSVKGVPKPSRIIYLHRDGVSLTGGVDDAANGVSSIVTALGLTEAKVPGFTGSNKTWKWVVTCVGKKFEAFDVQVTDVRPTDTDDYVLVAVGGKSSDLMGGKDDLHAGGLAPFNSKVIPKAVVFAFSKALRNKQRDICEVIGMEVGHAYGLDHGYHCRDLMTYKKYCGYKRFQDEPIACGEDKPRLCSNGEQTQNSYQHLLKVLGPAKPAAN